MLGIAYQYEGEVMFAKHHGMPFGATASVEAWHQIGDVILEIARVLLHMPVYRYVDDYFCAERTETMRHSMQMFAALVRLLLGLQSRWWLQATAPQCQMPSLTSYVQSVMPYCSRGS